ncbi:protein unc-93 homolog B1 isoform X3 [Falco naumanni]|uniref:protein unc-93 homolog B1 isoform X3 n=1 Tax=Falco naumanni TaxID=148594 RepID=UPI001ADEAB90|nr:protein unc-93 homolog B1 isoform X3 [Falco naumanni]
MRGCGAHGCQCCGAGHRGAEHVGAGSGGAGHMGARCWGCNTWVRGLGVLGIGVQSIWVQSLGVLAQGCSSGGTRHMGARLGDANRVPLPHPGPLLPVAAMEKDPTYYQDAAKAVGGNGLGAEGTEAQLDDFVSTHPDYNEEEEEQKYFRRKRLGVVKNVLAASLAGMLTYGVYLGLLQMQLILHYDETYREVKYSNIELEDIDRKVLMGINITPVAALLYTPILIRFFGTKWAMFLAVGIYALFVSSNYWERYYTLVPSAVAIGVAIVPLWASMGNYITRMAQKYYEYVNYKEEHVQEQQQAPRGACNTYIIIFQTIFYACFHLSFVCAQMPMLFFLNNYLYQLNHTLFGVKHCGTLSHGTLPGFNKTVLQSLPRSVNLIIVESALMAAAFLAMLVVLVLCGSAYRPTEEIDLRSIGWGNIFQLPFKHMRDYRLRHLFPLFIYSGFEVLFVCTGFSLPGPLHAAPAAAYPTASWNTHPRRPPGDSFLLGTRAPACGPGTSALHHSRALGHRKCPQQDQH